MIYINAYTFNCNEEINMNLSELYNTRKSLISNYQNATNNNASSSIQMVQTIFLYLTRKYFVSYNSNICIISIDQDNKFHIRDLTG